MKRKRIRTVPVLLVFILLYHYNAGVLTGIQAETDTPSLRYYIKIPGVAGAVQDPGFKKWIQCSAVQYNVPGIPAPSALIKREPEKFMGILTAKEVERPFASFSKLLDKADPIIYKAFHDQRSFPQWELTLCTSAGKAYMAFIFKDVVIVGVKERDNKQYITFKYQKIIWNYSPLPKESLDPFNR
jgi:type VI protein secretion system component Hcp